MLCCFYTQWTSFKIIMILRWAGAFAEQVILFINHLITLENVTALATSHTDCYPANPLPCPLSSLCFSTSGVALPSSVRGGTHWNLHNVLHHGCLHMPLSVIDLASVFFICVSNSSPTKYISCYGNNYFVGMSNLHDSNKSSKKSVHMLHLLLHSVTC